MFHSEVFSLSPFQTSPKGRVKIMSKCLGYLTYLWLLIFRRGTYVGAACFGLATSTPEQIHTEQIIFAINTSHLKSVYAASKRELSRQVKITNGTAILPTNMCHALSAGYDIHYFHPKEELNKLKGNYCLNTIFFKGHRISLHLQRTSRTKNSIL